MSIVPLVRAEPRAHRESESSLVGMWHDKTLKEQEKKSLNAFRAAVQGPLTPSVLRLTAERARWEAELAPVLRRRNPAWSGHSTTVALGGGLPWTAVVLGPVAGGGRTLVPVGAYFHRQPCSSQAKLREFATIVSANPA